MGDGVMIGFDEPIVKTVKWSTVSNSLVSEKG